jgi:hypothetical protein
MGPRYLLRKFRDDGASYIQHDVLYNSLGLNSSYGFFSQIGQVALGRQVF